MNVRRLLPILLLVVPGSALMAQTSASSGAGFEAGAVRSNTPFAPFIRVGEELTFDVMSARFGNMGTATMRTRVDTLDARVAYRLSFDFAARVMLFKVSDRTRSWIDAETMNTIRYQKCERSPLGTRDEDAIIRSGVWTDASGEHPLAAAAPLDELAFIFLVRASASAVDADGIAVNRHFDEKRNSVRLTRRGNARVAALGDTLDANIIQMDARDSRQKSGTSRIIFYVGGDPAHLPLRIDSSMPMAGTVTMTLKTVKPNAALVAEK